MSKCNHGLDGLDGCSVCLNEALATALHQLEEERERWNKEREGWRKEAQYLAERCSSLEAAIREHRDALHNEDGKPRHEAASMTRGPNQRLYAALTDSEGSEAG